MRIKETLKEFLKPTKGKWVWFGILLVVAVIFALILAMPSFWQPLPAWLSSAVISLAIAGILMIAWPFTILNMLLPLLPGFFMALAINIFYIYLLSCAFSLLDMKINKKIRIPSIVLFFILMSLVVVFLIFSSGSQTTQPPEVPECIPAADANFCASLSEEECKNSDACTMEPMLRCNLSETGGTGLCVGTFGRDCRPRCLDSQQ